MAKRRVQVEAGSGNVFEDLGYADAGERTLKVQLAVEVNRFLGARGLTQAAAAKLLGIRQPHVSDLARYRLDRFSAERLMAFLVGLGQDVEIRIRARAARGAGKARRGLALLGLRRQCRQANKADRRDDWRKFLHLPE